MNSLSLKNYFLLLFVIGVSLSDVAAYEIKTHKDMSATSVLASAAVQKQLINFELPNVKAKLTSNGKTLTVEDWVREGAEHEDDTFTSVFARYRNHFYDPIHNRGFGGIFYRNSGFLQGMPAQDWGLEDSGHIDGQYYSFRAARRYMFYGLVLPTKAERDNYLGLMFRSLGDVVHLVQDMAQPQHTRNESHGLPGSLYEQYTDKQNIEEILKSQPAFPVPVFTRARDFFSNDDGTGMAQYSNMNFVTAGTNFIYKDSLTLPNGLYAYPIPGQDEKVSVHDPSLRLSDVIKNYCGQLCTMRLISSINDKGEIQPRAATLSIFADDLVAYEKNTPLPDLDKSLRYSLNRVNFDAMHQKLIPRAVAYSTGMLDYFFRGDIDLVKDQDNRGAYVVKNNSDEPMQGAFALYYETTDNQRTAHTAARWDLSVPAHGQSEPVRIGRPREQANKEGEYLLVFLGKMGEEQLLYSTDGAAGAVAAKMISTDDCPYGETLKHGFKARYGRAQNGPYLPYDAFFLTAAATCQAVAGYTGDAFTHTITLPNGEFQCMSIFKEGDDGGGISVAFAIATPSGGCFP